MPAPYDANPFAATDAERAALWKTLVHDDIDAFIRCDWPAHARDIDAETFFGINAQNSADPLQWTPEFPALEIYRKTWLGFAEGAFGRASPDYLRQCHFAASRLIKIDLNGDFAQCLKSFDGHITFDDGTTERLFWETAYFCRKTLGKWRITGFVGYLPGRKSD